MGNLVHLIIEGVIYQHVCLNRQMLGWSNLGSVEKAQGGHQGHVYIASFQRPGVPEMRQVAALERL